MHGPADPHIYIFLLKSIGRIDMIIVSILIVKIASRLTSGPALNLLCCKLWAKSLIVKKYLLI